jgi:Uri superfamily endonuclease
LNRKGEVLGVATVIEILVTRDQKPGGGGGGSPLRTRSASRPGTVYFKNGREVLCDTAWKEGRTVFLVIHMKSLSKRVERHRRIRKEVHWHIASFSTAAEFHAGLPVRSEDDLECELASEMSSISEWSVPGFGCTDCSCPSHLFGFSTDPMSIREFHYALQYYRMDRLLEKYPLS